MLVAIAEDSALFREGLAALLRSAGIDVAATAATGVELERLLSPTSDSPPVDAVLVDVRMPPSYRDEGIVTALRLRTDRPGLGVLVLSTYAQAAEAVRLLESGSAGIGYLLKDRVDDVPALSDVLRRLIAGETVLDPQIVTGLLRRAPATSPLHTLTDGERAVLEQMAQGRSNSDIGPELALDARTVQTLIAAVVDKLGLAGAPTDNRRVLAVLSYLRASIEPDD